jgi:glycosyltransferase involved in cell wall biosynthesis
MALTELVAESGIPTVAHHHDFSWERTRFIENCVSDILQWAYPPVAPNLHHVVINSQAREELARRRGLHATLIPNVMDFATDPTGIDEYNRNLRAQIGIAPEELFVLQPTRVIPRKGIEHAIDLVAALGERLQHGVALVISHSSGDEGEDYKEHLERYARRLGVRLLFADHRIGDSRQTLSDGSLRLSLGDAYTHADLVTYPSSVEGFGNAFLEAIYYKRPLVVSPYPVYQRDIRPLGFDVLELEQFLTPALVEQVVALLGDERRRKRMIETNYRLASRHFSYELLAEKLRSVLRQLADAATTP